ncbi:excalibur calcium-binding domain-containing protein [Nocardioides sp. URHA0020]|uniref:excalibur calcium-binding domain-containing protein n=1 Tax=Nocardioides sp. URHA0020 TaxID=1380392 RepID=UPI00048D3C79|nr:excalibur calcium-binding domain-containing protein [Nocardioides sp. URHA0020]
MNKLVTVVATFALLGGSVALASGAEAAPRPKEYKNCTALNKVYPHGVGLRNAKDKTSGTRVRTFTKNPTVYKLNKKSDRDKDGIACEKA